MQQLKTSFLNKEQLPLVIEPKDKNCSLLDLKRILQEDNEFFKKSLLKYGGLLFRNFPIHHSDDFASVVKSLDTGTFVNYIGGGAPRIKVKDSIYTSTEAPPGIKILLHNEMSFAENYPHHIFFYCDVPPSQGGETFIADGRKVIQSVDESLKNKFEKKRLKYISRYYYKSRLMDLMNKIQKGHKTWIDVFETDKKTEVEANCKDNNIKFQWHKKDWLEISRVRSPFLEHPITKDLVWFNQIHLFDYNPRFLGWLRYLGVRLLKRLVDEARFGDDTPISRKEIYHVLDVLDKHSIYFPWQKGDVMALDNILTMHARAPFKGKRKILTIMTKP